MPAAILKCERVSHPPLRFIGKRSDAYPNWGDAWANDWFGEIEKAGATAEINDDSYCVLTGITPEGVEFYLGEFFPANTPVPDGFDFADLPAMDAGIAYIKGKVEEVYALTVPDKISELLAAFASEGIAASRRETSPRWISFERDNCPRFTDPDADGNVILDYAIYLN
ncbi:MAG: hypothetical protein LBN43_08335 [Oscillospiraceae bacterium]|jgi:hypothetical protein|nr:hypothetical protein [Oscillospiraceae bacterium]